MLAYPTRSVGHWNLNFWRLEQFYTNFLSKGLVDTYSKPYTYLKQTKEHYEATEMMTRKVDVCAYNWEFHSSDTSQTLKLSSSITKTAHEKFRATSGSLPTTFVVIL